MKNKKYLKQAIILSILMNSAVVGSAYAEDLTVKHIINSGSTQTNGDNIYGVVGNYYYLNGKYTYNDQQIKYDNIDIEVKNNYYSDREDSGELAIGVASTPDTDAILHSANGIKINVEARSAHDGSGIFARYGHKVELNADAGDIQINVSKTIGYYVSGTISPAYQKSNVYGLEVISSNVNLSAGKNIIISAGYDKEAAEKNYKLKEGLFTGIYNYKGNVDLNAGDSILISSNTANGYAYGIYATNFKAGDDANNSERETVVDLSSSKNYIEATADGTGMAVGIVATDGAKMNITGDTYVHGDNGGMLIKGKGEVTEGYQVTVNDNLLASAKKDWAVSMINSSMQVAGSEGLVGRGLHMKNSVKEINGSLYTSGAVEGAAAELTESKLTVGDDIRVVSADSTGISITNSDLSVGGNISVSGKDIGIKVNNSSNNIVKLGSADSINFIIGNDAALDLAAGKMEINGNTYFQSDLTNKTSAAVKVAKNAEFIADGTVTALGGLQGFKVEAGGKVTINGGSGVNFFKAIDARENVSDTEDDAFGNAVNVAAGGEFIAGGSGNILQAGNLEAGAVYNDPTDITNSQTGLHGSETAISSIGGSVKLTADGLINYIQGAIYAGSEADVAITAKNGADNVILASTHGRASSSSDDNGEHLVSAVYATGGSAIGVDAGMDGRNIISSNFEMGTGEHAHKEDREITVWAEDGSTVNIRGAVNISSSNNWHDTVGGDGTETKGNSLGIAVSSGERTLEFVDDDPGKGLVEAENISKVNIDYASNIKESSIIGDIVAGYSGEINIGQNLIALLDGQTVSGGGDSYLSVKGNMLAANGGVINADLGAGGIWIGRADDYADAGYGANASNHQDFYNPAFSNTIVAGGEVNIKMGQGSLWALTGQSFVTSLEANGSVIDMAGATIAEDTALDNDHNHALVIGEFKGNGSTFIMDLDAGSLGKSDMLYIKDNQGTFNVQLKDAINEADLKALGEDGLRFATIHGNVDGITVDTYGQVRAAYAGTGFSNVTYIVEERVYNDEDGNNDIYNNGNTDNSFDQGKPGSGFVTDNFEDGDTNLVITGVAARETGGVGQTIIDMSKANYSNAIYMDRLNKRMGEARFIDGDEGMWVRLRHDRIGKENAFRSQNTMYEIGYDAKQVEENGEHRVGFAIDYMDGEASYSKLGGSGEISRKGLWLYDTWLGEKGHYRDIVAKWGHLSNDFDIMAMNGADVQGDYSNNVYSISAEYGKKNDLGNNWYFEPQAQLQYAHVTGAEYLTNADTKVNVDAINSLIARAGFRLGKDLGERSTVYFKADLLHEFLGEQDVFAMDDSTGVNGVHEKYDHAGTWCDVGFGFATAMSKNSYAYLDLETSLGNDYEETYQINAGMQWTF